MSNFNFQGAKGPAPPSDAYGKNKNSTFIGCKRICHVKVNSHLFAGNGSYIVRASLLTTICPAQNNQNLQYSYSNGKTSPHKKKCFHSCLPHSTRLKSAMLMFAKVVGHFQAPEAKLGLTGVDVIAPK